MGNTLSLLSNHCESNITSNIYPPLSDTDIFETTLLVLLPTLSTANSGKKCA